MLLITVLIIAAVAYILYKRYMPVTGVQCENIQSGNIEEETVIVDLRDYNSATGQCVEETIHIPIAYIKRNYREIPKRNVHIIVDNQVEKNMGVRLLRQKGINVVSYTMPECCMQK
ncbi:MAG: sulfurtransferase [Bacillus sp. (in: firmicutes)]